MTTESKQALGRPAQSMVVRQAPTNRNSMSANQMRNAIQTLRTETAKVIVGKRNVIEYLVAASLTEGAHILFEDMPGLAKSVLAATYSKAAGCKFTRIQFTPDLLPTDISGGHIFNRQSNEFDFRRGPLFTNFLLADEINRASPKTQSALLEAMAEKQVSVEGVTHALEPPFMVLATQNPVEQEGTYPLPEAQMDRFAMRLSMGYPTKDEAVEIMNRRLGRGRDSFDVKSVITRQQLLEMQAFVESIHVDAGIVDYIARIVDATCKHPDLVAGSSPRGSLMLVKMARSWATLQGRNYVIPDDVRELVVPVLAHRTILATDARVRGRTQQEVLQDITRRIPVPRTATPV